MALLDVLDPVTTRALLGLAPKRGVREFIPELRAGFPSKTIVSLANRLDLPPVTVWESLGLAARTLARRRTAKRLTLEESERLLRVAIVLAAASDALGSMEKARRWLQKESMALDDVPLRMLDTDIGASLVLDELGRIEHGIFA